jgi:syntaxin-binding protein 5
VNGYLASKNLDTRLLVHYGIQSTASVLAFDPIQRLLAIGTLDGRIKVIGGDNIEGLLFSPAQLPYKYLEFIVNEGYLVSISNDNDIQVWNMESRCIACSLLWESNITSFSIIRGSHFMYIGDENGLMSILKFEVDDGTLVLMPYHLSSDSLAEAVGSSFLNNQPIIGVLPQPSSSGNRVLIAYESGLLILWDISEGRAVVVRGDKVLELKDGLLTNDTTGLPLEDKEISALCWASSSGALLAVGYVDGDILFWKTSTKPSNKGQKDGSSNNSVVKLQLSSAERRLPIILLHWSANSKSQNDGDGKLFVYGGDEIGGDEVLTVLSLEWNSGMDTLRCVGRVDLTLTGSFADMILSPSAGAVLNNQDASVFVLTNPGRLHYFDHDSLSLSSSEKERKVCISSMEYPAVIPTANPVLTFSKLCQLIPSENSSKALLEIVRQMKSGKRGSNTTVKWPLTGGVANQIGFDEDSKVERVYVTGYEDGSLRIWDATFPLFSLLCHLQPQIKGKEVAGSNASVSKVDFCSMTLGLAVGNKCGLVRLYNLNDSLDKTSFHYVTETEHEVLNLPQEKGVNCRAVFHLLDSPVQALDFVHKGAKLCVGYECGRVAVLDISSLTLLFLTTGSANPSSPLISMVWKRYLNYDSHIKSPKTSNTESKVPEDSTTELMFLLTKDSKVHVIDGVNGNMIGRPLHLKKDSTVISMYVIEGKAASTNESSKDNSYSGTDEREAETSSPKHRLLSGESLKESLVLICCKDALHLYRTKNVIKGDDKSISKVKLENSCCWTTILVKDERICGIVLLYQTGVLEVRSLPNLELQKETSLMSILRWNFKANMERTVTSTDNGLIALANGYEVAFISILAGENDFRIPEYLPCLHDKVLAAATETAINFSTNQKKKQVTSPRILGGIVKGFKGAKTNSELDHSAFSKSNFSHLDGVFSRKPLLNPPQTVADSEEVVELSIDDIIIDEPVPIASTSSQKVHKNEREKRTERERLFEDGDADPTPKLRTREEIIATYRKAGDASSVAGEARNKLIERQEKLQRISKQTEDLRNGAENFASLANELVKVMESRKWWQKF